MQNMLSNESMGNEKISNDRIQHLQMASTCPRTCQTAPTCPRECPRQKGAENPILRPAPLKSVPRKSLTRGFSTQEKVKSHADFCTALIPKNSYFI